MTATIELTGEVASKAMSRLSCGVNSAAVGRLYAEIHHEIH
jgi:hypothetical protein